MQFLVVDVEGVLLAVSFLFEEGVGHLNFQQVVQHGRLCPDQLLVVKWGWLAETKVVRNEGVELV